MGCENLDPVGVVLTQFVFSQHDGIQFGSALCLANRTALHKGSGSAFTRADISAGHVAP